MAPITGRRHAAAAHRGRPPWGRRPGSAEDKLRVPWPCFPVLRRDRVSGLLDAATRRRVALVCAAAGGQPARGARGAAGHGCTGTV